MDDKKQLKFILEVLKKIPHSKDNQWFWNGVSEISGRGNSYYMSPHLKEIKGDTQKIRYFLDIPHECSVDYAFISHKVLRMRLEYDNLRMENVRYNLDEKDENKRLFEFIVNAFYQIENLINYFYYEKFPNIDDLLAHLESIDGTNFKRNNENNIGDINVATKLFSFRKTYFNIPGNYTGLNIDNLRQIRNEGLHRISRIKNIQNENKRLHDFLNYATFDSITLLVKDLALKVKQNL